MDAVVYRGASHLDSDAIKSTNDAFEEAVIHKRLGNASFIAELSEEILCFIGRDSVLYRNILYSGSHSGDAVSTDDLDSLESEIKEIEEASRNSTVELQAFLKEIRELLIAAREQNSPIVFV